MQNDLLLVKNLQVVFKSEEGTVNAVQDTSFTVKSGETLGIVGESGSGKSVTSLSIMKLIPNPPGEITGGEIFFNGRNLLKLTDKEIRDIRGNEISMVFQEPMTSLNPIHTCGKQIMEPLILHKGYKKKAAYEKAMELLKQVGIPSPEQRIKEYPHQLSGGMRQRIMIAMALACKPKLLIADEPTTALDVTIQAQIIELFKELKKEINAGIIMITHNMGVVAEMCDRVIVMYTGQVLEEAPVNELFKNPLHPYTLGLLKSIPKITTEKVRLTAIEGTVPNPTNMPRGCSFHPRCTEAAEICRKENPELSTRNESHKVRCWKYI